MPPGRPPTDDDIPLARQLLRFIQTDHPFAATLVTDQDVQIATHLADEDNGHIPAFEEDYPVAWVESRRQFNTFLRNWRKLDIPSASANANQEGPESDEPRLPLEQVQPTSSTLSQDLRTSQTQSQTQSQPAATPHRTERDPTPVTPNRPIESDLTDLSAKLQKFHVHNPMDQSSDPSNTRPPPKRAMATPLTAEEAQRLIREAINQQEDRQVQNMAALLAAQSSQHNQNMAQLLATARQETGASIRSADVGYFDPSAKDPTSAGLIADGKVTKYTDVHAFTDRLKHLAAQQSEADVRKVWTQCLLGPALIWHSQVLSDADRRLLETASIQAISDKLIERFKPSWSVAMSKLQAHQFTLENIHKGQDILGFVQRVVRDAKNCDQSPANQLKVAFEAFDGDIQSQLKVPTQTTTLDDFLTHIREREGVLRKMAHDKISRSQSNIYPNSPRFFNFPPRDNQFRANQYNQRGNQFLRGRRGYGGYGGYGRGSPPYGRFDQYPPRRPDPVGGQQGLPWQRNSPYPQNQQQNPPGQWRPQPAPAQNIIPPDRRLPPPPPKGPAAWQPRPEKAYHGDEHTEPVPDAPDTQPDPNTADGMFTQEDFETWDEAKTYDDDGSYETAPYTATPHTSYRPMSDYQTSEAAEDCGFASIFHGSCDAPRQRCRDCNNEFPSKNKLHRHLRDVHGKGRRPSEQTLHADHDAQHARLDISSLLNPADNTDKASPQHPSHHPRIIYSRATPVPGLGTGYGFRTYGYLKFFITPDPRDLATEHGICGDTGCSKTVGDRTWIKSNFPRVEWRKRATPITLRGIGTTLHSTDDYVLLPMYFQGTDSSQQPAMAHFVREVALVDDLRANMLIGTDILQPEEFDILMSQRTAIINSCDVTIRMETTPRGKPQKTTVRVATPKTIGAHSYAMLTVQHEAEDTGEDLLFEPANSPLSTFATITTAGMEEILVRNDTAKDVTLPTGRVIGHLMTIDPDCIAYQVDVDRATTAAEFAVRRPTRPRENRNGQFISDPDQTVKHRTGVNIYNHPDVVPAVAKLLDEFEIVFTDTGFADIPEDEWMKITLKDGWQKEIPKHCRIYPLNNESQQVVEETIGGLQQGHKLYRTVTQVPFSFPVFVIWKPVHKPDGTVQRKGRMVVDIRPGNKIFLKDAYPVRTQDEILAHIAGKPYQTILDAIAFYYQWRVHPSSQWAFTITTHKGQFTFNCAVMGYKNSNAYVQRQMDFLLQDTAARSYCDDIVIASDTLSIHIQDLRDVFTIFRDRNISIGPSKSYIAFPNTMVLGRLVDSFGMTTTEQKLDAVKRLKFPETLRDLETFIGLTTWLRTSVPGYGILVKPLQDRKTNLLKRIRSKATQSKTARQALTQSIVFSYPTKAEKDAFTWIKDALLENITLAFCSPVRQLFMDFDASVHGIGIEVYHVKEEVIPTLMKDGLIVGYPPRHAIQTIAFLSRPLTNAETKYWPTEMELCGFVWLLKKCKQWINTARMTPIIFTDCKAIIGLYGRNTDIASSTAASSANRKIVHALEYISQFTLRIIHKPGKTHVVPDALSRLPREHSTSDPAPNDPGGLDDLPDDREEHWAVHWIHQAEDIPQLPPIQTGHPEIFDVNVPLGGPYRDSVSLVQMDPDFKARLQKGYLEDPYFHKILDILKTETRLQPENRVQQPFYLRQGVLWSISDTMADRLCIPRSCVSDLWEAIHGPSHISYGKLVHLLQMFCIHRGLKRLKEYIDGCPECRILQPRHHKPYGSLQPILSPPCPYYQITMDFILALPISDKNSFDTILVTVCKLTKQIQLVPGRKDWTAEQWATAFISRLLTVSWGIPRVIISDRDPKFMSAFWQTIWKTLQTKLLYTTAYHPQADGQSEIVVQVTQSALRYYIHGMENPAQWEDIVPRLQFEYNNAKHATTGKSPNELAFGFTPANVADVLTQKKPQQDDSIRHVLLPATRIEATDAIALASMTMKYYYDRRHQPRYFNVGDRVLLRLHKGYKIPSTVVTGQKMAQRYAGPFRVLERIGTLAYRLDLKDYNPNIHDVVSVDHLEPAPLDVYARQLPPIGPIRAADHPRERIIAIRTFGKDKKTQYLVKYKDLGHEFDEWLTREDLGGDSHLIDAFTRAK